MNWKTLAIFGILATLLVALVISKPFLAISIWDNEEKEKENKEEKCKKKISMEEAINITLKFLKENYGNYNYTLKSYNYTLKCYNYTLIKSEIKDEKYEFKFTNQTVIFEIEVDACNGKIIKIEIEKMKIKPHLNLISHAQAINITINFLKQNFGDKNYTLLKIELEGKIYEIKVTDGENIYEVKINGLNGEIIKVEVKGINLEIEKKIENERKIEIETINKTIIEGLKIVIGKGNNTILKINFIEKGNLTKTELEITLIFDRLIEYFDDGNLKGTFDNNDTILAFINLHSLNWTTEVNNISDSQGNLVEILIVQKADLKNQGKISLVYHIIPSTETFNILNQNIKVNIYKVKFDLYIENFPWNNDNSLLALQLKFNNEFEYKDKNLKVKFKTIGNIIPFFEWGGEAYVDGNLVKVNATIDKNQVYLSYPHFTQTLKHDPSLGYEVYSALSTTSTETQTSIITIPKTETQTSIITKTETQTSIIPKTETQTSIIPKTETQTSIITIPKTETQTIIPTTPLRLFEDTLFLIMSLILLLTVIMTLIYKNRKLKKEIGI